MRRFDSNFAIAESWRRLAFDFQNVKSHDITLLRHEIMEMELVIKGTPQNIAHDITSERYNYPEESKSFYRNLRLAKHKQSYFKNDNQILERNEIDGRD